MTEKRAGSLDPLLRDVAARGPWVSAHPDVILKMGVKEVLYRTRHLDWDTETHIYRSAQAFREEFPARLSLADPRMLKQNRGNGEQGVWTVEQYRPATRWSTSGKCAARAEEQRRIVTVTAGSGRIGGWMRAALSLACGGSGRGRARHPRPKPPRCDGGKAFLQAAAAGPAVRAAGDRDRQTEELRCGKAVGAAQRRASTKPLSEQLCRKLTSADTTSGTAEATIQISRASSRLPLRTRVHLWSLPSTPAPTGRECLTRETCARYTA
jgi:hypothetical protein